jgi:hypothetical protein
MILLEGMMNFYVSLFFYTPYHLHDQAEMGNGQIGQQIKIGN